MRTVGCVRVRAGSGAYGAFLVRRRRRYSSPAGASAEDALTLAAVSGRGLSAPETWDAFFGDFYLRAYAGAQRDSEAAGQALAAARLARCPDGGDLLDVACGFGRHAAPLAEAGYRVTGVDRSGSLLDEARRRAGGRADLALVQADYRSLPLRDGSFDAALNLFSSLGYLGDEADTQVLAEIRRVLRPEGRLVIETMHRDELVREFSERDWRLAGEGRLLLEQRTFEAASGVAQVTQTLIEPSGRRESRSYSVRVYAVTELLAMLARAGFEETRAYGDLDGSPFDVGTRLVVAAQR